MLIHLIFVISLLPFTLGQSYVALAEYTSADCAGGSIQSVKAFPTGCSLYINSFVSGRQSIKHVCNGTSIEVYECTDSNCQSCTLRTPPAADFTCYSDSGSYWKRTCAASVAELPAMPENSLIRETHWYYEQSQAECALPGTYLQGSVNGYCENLYNKYTCTAQSMGASFCSSGDCACSGTDTFTNWNTCYNESASVAIGCVGLYQGTLNWPRYVPPAPQSPSPAPVVAPTMPPAQSATPTSSPLATAAPTTAPVAAPVSPPLSPPLSPPVTPPTCRASRDRSGRILADPVVPTDTAILSSTAWQFASSSKNETSWCCASAPTLTKSVTFQLGIPEAPAGDTSSCQALRQKWIVAALCSRSAQQSVSYGGTWVFSPSGDYFKVNVCPRGCKILADACGLTLPEGTGDSNCPPLLDQFVWPDNRWSVAWVNFNSTNCWSASMHLAPSLVLLSSLVMLIFAIGL